MIPVGAVTLAGNILRVFLPWWEKTQKVQMNQAELEAIRERYRLEVDLDGRRFDRIRLEAMAAVYPLGVPGRLRNISGSANPLMPRVLIAPISADGRWDGVTQLTEQALADFGSSDEMFAVVRGAFVAARPGARLMSQTVAAEIARYEFDPAPSVIVFEERHGPGVTISARLSALAVTSAGDSSFDVPLVRFANGSISVCWWDLDDGGQALSQSWLPLPADLVSVSEPDAIAEVLTSSVVAIVAMYWETRGVRWQSSRSEYRALARLLDIPAWTDSQRHEAGAERLLTELAAMESRYGQVTLTALGEFLLAISAARLPGLAFVVTPGYPAEPPRLLETDDLGAVSEIPIADGAWNPAHSLLELCEGVEDGAADFAL